MNTRKRRRRLPKEIINIFDMVTYVDNVEYIAVNKEYVDTNNLKAIYHKDRYYVKLEDELESNLGIKVDVICIDDDYYGVYVERLNNELLIKLQDIAKVISIEATNDKLCVCCKYDAQNQLHLE